MFISVVTKCYLNLEVGGLSITHIQYFSSHDVKRMVLGHTFTKASLQKAVAIV